MPRKGNELSSVGHRNSIAAGRRRAADPMDHLPRPARVFDLYDCHSRYQAPDPTSGYANGVSLPDGQRHAPALFAPRAGTAVANHSNTASPLCYSFVGGEWLQRRVFFICLGYQRSSRGPRQAPRPVGISIPTRYQTPRNGAASSGQYNEYTSAPVAAAAKPAAAPARRNCVGANPRKAQKKPMKSGIDAHGISREHSRAIWPKINEPRSWRGALTNATAAIVHSTRTGIASPNGTKPRRVPGRARRVTAMNPTRARAEQNASRTQNIGAVGPCHPNNRVRSKPRTLAVRRSAPSVPAISTDKNRLPVRFGSTGSTAVASKDTRSSVFTSCPASSERAP